MGKSLLTKFNQQTKATLATTVFALTALFSGRAVLEANKAPEKKKPVTESIEKDKVPYTFSFYHFPFYRHHWDWVGHRSSKGRFRVGASAQLSTPDYGSWELFTFTPVAKDKRVWGATRVFNLFSVPVFKKDLHVRLGLGATFERTEINIPRQNVRGDFVPQREEPVLPIPFGEVRANMNVWQKGSSGIGFQVKAGADAHGNAYLASPVLYGFHQF